ncbi:MAG: ATP phosphoribosyltransferase [Rhodospirillaceae bacterium]|nr:MAG: ATP phosphoribosyltransferase [Rhodospirillaceae bacterium]
MTAANENLRLAVPRGRILEEMLPLMAEAGIEPEPAFYDKHERKLEFASNIPNLSILRVRSFDIATFVAFGVAQIGIAGRDVLMEFDFPEVYAPLDLRIGACRMVVAQSRELREKDNPRRWSHVRVATKYPEITRRHFAARGVQAECVKLNGAMEIAPSLGLCRRIVDLVSTGSTLEANGLEEVEEIAKITSRLVVNRAAMKTRPAEIHGWIDRFEEARDAA